MSQEPEPIHTSYPIDPNIIFNEQGDNWYITSRFYWSIQEPNVESMVGGVDEFSSSDLRFSYAVLLLLKSEKKLNSSRIADCGGGIGRVSFQVLSHFFEKIDVIDPIPHFLLKAREALEKELPIEVEQVGIEEWTPKQTYSAFWIQWTFSYLTDSDIVAFLKRCKEHSTDDCLFFVKENIAGPELKSEKTCYEYYPEKNCICRSFTHYQALFEEAGLIIEEWRQQPNWPDEFLPVVLFILRK